MICGVCELIGRHRLWPACIGQTISANNRLHNDKAFTHLTGHVHIQKVMLANEMQHQPKLAHIGRGMCESVGRYLHRLTSGNIIQGLCSSCNQHWPTIRSISQGLHTLTMAYAHWQGNICVGQRHITSTKSRVLRDRDFTQQKAASTMQHWSWFIALGMSFAHRIADVDRGLDALAMTCAHHSSIVKYCLSASLLSCTRSPADTGRGVPSSALAYIILNQHCLLTSYIVLGFCILLINRRAWIAYIIFGLHTTVNQH